MTVRLHMKLGLVAESQRPADSPDTVLVVEPSIGSTTRTKGSLYLVVTGDGGGELRTATNMVAERIRHEYYYDESAGITVCLKKAIKAANRELRVTERLVARHGEGGPIGIALAVVRGNELYVATVGPAEAYLVREARLLTLPEPGPASGLPNEDVADAEVWHGDLLAGDSLILISPNATRRIGLAPIQDAVIQLHPQVAIDQIHRQLTGGGIGIAGGDGMIALEADEVSITQKIQPLKPVWPSDSLAGVPDRSPIPLADTIVDGVGNVQHTAKHVQRPADGMLRHGVYGLFERMPRRPVRRVRVTPIAVQRERQRRVASAVVGMLLVLTVVGASLWYLAGARRICTPISRPRPRPPSRRSERRGPGLGQRPRSDDQQPAHGHASARRRLLQHQHRAGQRLLGRRSRGHPGPRRRRPEPALSRQRDLAVGRAFVRQRPIGRPGARPEDGGAYVIDGTNGVVYRVDLVTRAKREIAVTGRSRQRRCRRHSAPARDGGPDVLILDSANTLWRWRPAVSAAPGDGTLVRVNVDDSGSWGSGVRAIGTFVTAPDLGQYTLYIVVPSAGQVEKYPASSDGSGYYAKAKTDYLAPAGPGRDRRGRHVHRRQPVTCSTTASPSGTTPASRSGTGPRTRRRHRHPSEQAFYTAIAADNRVADQGNLYGYDGVGQRVVSFTKSNGKYVQEFVLPTGSPYFSALQGDVHPHGPQDRRHDAVLDRERQPPDRPDLGARAQPREPVAHPHDDPHAHA